MTAVREGDAWVFRDAAQPPASYRYVGRLREGVGQRIAHLLGIEMSRVGVDDPEWVRLKRKMPKRTKDLSG